MLSGVIFHLGDGAEFGHYVAYVHRGGRWWGTDDKHVDPIPLSDVLQNRLTDVIQARQSGNLGSGPLNPVPAMFVYRRAPLAKPGRSGQAKASASAAGAKGDDKSGKAGKGAGQGPPAGPPPAPGGVGGASGPTAGDGASAPAAKGTGTQTRKARNGGTRRQRSDSPVLSPKAKPPGQHSGDADAGSGRGAKRGSASRDQGAVPVGSPPAKKTRFSQSGDGDKADGKAGEGKQRSTIHQLLDELSDADKLDALKNQGARPGSSKSPH